MFSTRPVDYGVPCGRVVEFVSVLIYRTLNIIENGFDFLNIASIRFRMTLKRKQK